MKLPSAFAILVGLALTATTWTQDAAKNDEQAMQGTWQATKLVAAGKTVPDDDLKKITYIISGDKFTIKFENEEVEARFKLDPGKKPKQFDMTFSRNGPDKGQTGLGIYELDGDTLKICFLVGDAGYKKRPADFKVGDNVLNKLMVMQRQKK